MNNNKKNILQLLCLLFLHLDMIATPSFHIERFREKNGFPQSIVTCVMQDKQGYIWISSWNGLSRYDGYSFTNYKTRQGDNCPMTTNRIEFVCESANGDIVCKHQDGFFLFKRKDRKFISLPNMTKAPTDRFRATKKQKELVASLPDYSGNDTRILFVDNQNGYWIYTHKGLDRVTFGRNPITPIKYSDGKEEFIRALFLDKKGRLIVSDKNGVIRISDINGNLIGFLSHNGEISKSPKVFGANVYSIFEDSHGYIWMGSKPNGLFRLTPSTNGGFTVKTFSLSPQNKFGINCNSIYSISEDKLGRIIIGTYGGGMNLIEKPWSKNPIFLNCDNLLRNYPNDAKFVHDILVKKDGTTLIGTRNGLYSCKLSKKAQQIKFYANLRKPSNKMSLSDNQVMNILETQNGKIYVATYGGGLNEINSHNLLTNNIQFVAHTTDTGMASDVTLSLCEDKNGHIWITSEHCFMKYLPKKKTFVNYSEGVFHDNFSFSEVKPLYIQKEDLLKFGTTQGVLNVRAKDLVKSTFVPHIVFDQPDLIELTPEEKSISIKIAALDYNKVEPIIYAYKLEGIDKQWLYTTDNHINLSNIPAGTFHLRVCSTNGDGVWVNNEKYIIIHRTPYFNERPEAWMLYSGVILAFILLVWNVIRYVKRLKKEINILRLSSDEKLEFIKVKLGDMLDGKESYNKNLLELPTENDSTENSKFKKKAEDFIKNNFGKSELSVADFANEMGMSRSVLYIKIKTIYGCTPNGYIQNYRIEKAYNLLKNDQAKNISEIAYYCGFTDPKYFSRCFKKNKGYTPTDFREKLSKNSEAIHKMS